MSVQFIQDGKVFDSGECSRNLNLLAHAQMIELSIGSTCGGHGKCGADRLRLDPRDFSKVNAPTGIEKIHFTADELAAGFRLGCQCFPEEDEMSIVVSLNIK